MDSRTDIVSNRTLRLNTEKVSLFAVIIDFSEPIRTDWGDYRVMLKVIDPTLNRTCEQFGPNKYNQTAVPIFFYAKDDKKDYLPNAVRVGDILRIRRFKFNLRDGTQELTGHELPFSNWMLFDILDSTIYQQKVIQEANKRDLFTSEALQLKDIRKWAFDFFQQWLLSNVLQWSKYIEPNIINYSQKEIKQERVDIILQLLKVERAYQSSEAKYYYKVNMQDIYQNKFFMLEEIEPQSSAGTVLKFKNVNIKISQALREVQIVVGLTSVMRVPSFFKDFQLFKQQTDREQVNLQQKKSLKENQSHFLNKQIFEKRFPFLKNYQFDVVILEQKLTQSFFENKTMTRKQFPEHYSILHDDFKDTFPIQMKEFLNFGQEEFIQNLYEKFVIQPISLEFIFNEKSFKLFCKKCKTNKNIKEIEKKEDLYCCKNLMRPFLIIKIKCQDYSIQSEDKIIVQMLLSQEDYNCISLLNLDLNFQDPIAFWQTEEQKLIQFKQKFWNYEKVPNGLKMVVELRQTKNYQVYMQLCNTILVPQRILCL